MQNTFDTLVAIDKLHKVFEPLTQRHEIASGLTQNQTSCEPQLPGVPIKTPTEKLAAMNEAPKNEAAQQHKHP